MSNNNNNVLIQQNGTKKQTHVIPIDNLETLPPTDQPILVRSISQKPTIDVIQEEYSSDVDVDTIDVKIKIKDNIEKNNDTKIFTINRNPLEGHVNGGFDVNTSSIDESYHSLPVISEQYCCCKSWTGLESTLLKGVGILVVIIIIVAIIVSIVKYTGQDDDKIPNDRNKFTWNF
ncbi:uncharacterized protein LOC123298770 [Chrysoperla carnea]|uniref:uncharacterized protein LOC123298770 n=1 Tax=Chrysoperla carnea TaxID=189513 RepID=UPI001D08D5BC|nr:uncharacterized protein LOC123298770 [Chrysoperla carnea]